MIPNGVIARDLFTLFSPRTALDVGCALGYLPRELRSLSVEAYGVDVSRWAVERANLPYVRQVNVADERLRDKFDLVTAYDVLEHIPEERLEFVVANLWDATARFLVVVPAVYEEGVTHDFNDPSHIVFHSRPWWESLFRRCGVTLDEGLAGRLNTMAHATTYNYAGRFLVGRKETRGSDATLG